MTFSYKVQGSQVTQTDAFFTVALRKVGDDWRLTAWAWTKGFTGWAEQLPSEVNTPGEADHHGRGHHWITQHGNTPGLNGRGWFGRRVSGRAEG